MPKNYNQELMVKMTGDAPPEWNLSENVKVYICGDGECYSTITNLYGGFINMKFTDIGRFEFRKIIRKNYEIDMITNDKIIIKSNDINDLIIKTNKLNILLFNTSLSILNKIIQC